MQTAIQILLVLVTALGTLGVTLIVQHFAHARERRAVRNQVVALMKAAATVLKIFYENPDAKAFRDSDIYLATALSTRLTDKDVALAFNGSELRSLMMLIVILGSFTEARAVYERTLQHNGDAKLTLSARNAFQTAAYIAASKIYYTLEDLGNPQRSAPTVPAHLEPVVEEARQQMARRGIVTDGVL